MKNLTILCTLSGLVIWLSMRSKDESHFTPIQETALVEMDGDLPAPLTHKSIETASIAVKTHLSTPVNTQNAAVKTRRAESEKTANRHIYRKVLHAAESYAELGRSYQSHKAIDSLFQNVANSPEKHRAILDNYSNMDLILLRYPSKQAEVRAFTGKYLMWLAKNGREEGIREVVEAISNDLETRGDRKGRRLDFEDAFMAWVATQDHQELKNNPEEVMSKVNIEPASWKHARMVLLNHVEGLEEDRDTYLRIVNAMQKGESA